MGIIDSFDWTMTCEHCGVTETVRALDYGSAYSGSHWRGPEQPESFTAKIGHGKYNPELTDPVCKKCDRPAKLSVR